MASIGFGLQGKARGNGLRKLSPAALADLARGFGKADDLAGLSIGGDGLSGDPADGLPSGDFLPFSGRISSANADSDGAVEMYEKIRGETGDTAKIAENTGLSKELLDRVKQHIFFDTHEIAVGPDTRRWPDPGCCGPGWPRDRRVCTCHRRLWQTSATRWPPAGGHRSSPRATHAHIQQNAAGLGLDAHFVPPSGP